MDQLTEKLKKDKRNYPILAWYESADQTQIIIITAPGEYKIITRFIQDIKKLYSELSLLLGSDDLIKSANKGDDTLHTFTINEFLESKPNWDLLLTELKAELNNIKELEDVAAVIKEELINNQRNDIAASALKCIYSSILYNLITKSLDLGITEMMIIGDITYEEGLSSVIENNLPQHMTMSFLQL